MHLIGFIIGIYHDARSSECQNTAKLHTPISCYIMTVTAQEIQYIIFWKQHISQYKICVNTRRKLPLLECAISNALSRY